MSVKLQAPLPLIQTTTSLPNPKFGDSESPQHGLSTRQAMDGTIYTYVKKRPQHRLNYTFVLSKEKALELRAFIIAYHRASIRVTNHKGEVWEVKIASNPAEFSTLSISSNPGGEEVEVTLEFLGIRISQPAPFEC